MGVGANNRPRTAHCGALDCRRAYDRVRTAANLRAYALANGVRYEDRYKIERICPDCGETFQTRQGETCRACQRRRAWDRGAAVSVAARLARAAERRVARGQLVLVGSVRRSDTLTFREAVRRLAVARVGTRSRRAIWVGATCNRCSASFVAMWTADLPRYCSKSCSRADAKVRRRQRGGEPVRYSRRLVFDRDRWICQLCGKRVKRTARVPDPKAPVIDHVVPLAVGVENGGVDAPWNVQCAHFLCNSIKRDQCTAPALF